MSSGDPAIDTGIATVRRDAPDIKLAMDGHGIIRTVSIADPAASGNVATWQGRRWAETVDSAGADQIDRLLEEAARDGVSAFAQILQMLPNGTEVPVEYTVVRLGGSEGVLAIGRNLAATAKVQARLTAVRRGREQEAWKLRELETRYRLLFESASDVMLVLRDDLRVLECNPAGQRALGIGIGDRFGNQLMRPDEAALRDLLHRAREHGRVPGMLVHFRGRPGAWTLRASMTATDDGPGFLLQLAAVAGQERLHGRRAAEVGELIDGLPDAFVITEADGTIRRANGAFLDLVQIGSEAAVLGESLGRWLCEPGADLAALLDTIRAHRAARLFTTTLHGELGLNCLVEISAASADPARQGRIGMVIRSLGRRMIGSEANLRLDETLRPLAERLGRASLKTLVRETTVVMERHYIEAALAKADGNRTLAAELLGLSRQSLYTKLGQIGVDGAGKAAAECPD